MLIHPMHTNKRVLMWTCLHSIDQSSSNSLKFGRILCFSTVMSFQLMGITFSVAYWMENWSIDLEKSLYTLLQVAATFSVIYPIVIAFCLRRKIAAMLMNLTSIYSEQRLLWANFICWFNFNFFDTSFRCDRRQRFVLYFNRNKHQHRMDLANVL